MMRQVKRIASILAARKGLLFGSLFILSLLAATLTTLKVAEAAQAKGCTGQGFSTAYTSTYTGACLGETSGTSFVELVVTLPNPVANAQVSFSNAAGNCGQSPCNFRKINNQTYVLNVDGRNLGYQVSGDSATCATAVVKDKNNQVTITASGNGKTESIGPIDLCQEVISRNWTISRTANTIPGDNGQASSKGQIVGTVTTVRPGAPANDTRRIGQAQKSGVMKITLTRQGGTALTGDSSSNWYTLVDGKLTIPNLDPGTYDLTLQYNDRVNAARDNFPAEWASSDITMTQTGIVVTGGQNTTVNLNGGAGATTGTPTKEAVCTTGDGLAGNLGWILCPLVQAIASATNFFENNIIIPFLTVSPLTTNGDNPVYILWQNLRNVANVGFIIFFFIIIFSQATSIGISNYGIKRMLPRLVVVIIAVNLSYFIVAFIIDAFNIFGAGISQLIMAALKQAGTTQLNGGSVADTKGIFALGGAALLTIIATGGAAIGWFFSLIGIAALVVVVVVVVLVLRQMGIIMLVIVSPVAILMYLLPNTEGYFNKWRKTLLQLLLMYPMIVLLFASGKIFSVVLQQPDLFANTTGLSAEVITAIRIILQFLVNVIPLAALPATLMASNAMIGGAYRWMHGRAVQPRAARLKEDAARIAGESQMRIAKNPLLRKTGIGQLAGRSLNKNFVRQQRAANLQRAQANYVAAAAGGTGVASSLLRRRAAGVGGQTGATRAAAAAANIVTKGRKEDIDNVMSLLDAEMRRIGVDQKTFARWTAEYMEDPDNVSKAVRTGSNGQTFNFKQNEGRLQRALLNSAAAQGEVGAIEAARLNGNIDQNIVDDIIRLNDGPLKGKGGFHLATNFNNAAGRMTKISRDTSGNMLDKNGSITTDINEAARLPITDATEMKAEMFRQRLSTFAGSGADSIATMKAGLLNNTSDMLKFALRSSAPARTDPDYTGPNGDELFKRDSEMYKVAKPAFDSLSYEDKHKIAMRMNEIVGNATTINKSEGGDAIREMRGTLAGFLTPPPTP